MEVLVEIYFTYGKLSGDELGSRFVIEDSVESRKELLDEYGYNETYDNVEAFINGQINTIHYSSFGGDWDDPTGKYIVIMTKEEAINSIKKQAKKEINEINKLFK